MKKQDNVKEKCKNRIIIKDIGSGTKLNRRIKKDNKIRDRWKENRVGGKQIKTE